MLSSLPLSLSLSLCYPNNNPIEQKPHFAWTNSKLVPITQQQRQQQHHLPAHQVSMVKVIVYLQQLFILLLFIIQ